MTEKGCGARGSETNSYLLFYGLFACVVQDHSRFVNCVRYAPDGDFFVSGGAEGKVCLACAMLSL